LAVISAWNVVWNFVFVDFDTNLLLLMGIANAMYLGFRQAENIVRQAHPVRLGAESGLEDLKVRRSVQAQVTNRDALNGQGGAHHAASAGGS
jgi:hypothetical protein